MADSLRDRLAATRVHQAGKLAETVTEWLEVTE